MTTEWVGKWALITGASAGIGVALATQLAEEGTHLVLTARRRDRLDELAQSLKLNHGIRTEVVVADLARPEAPQQIYEFTQQKKIEVDLLINNAGFGQYGELTSVETQRLLDMVQVNCVAVVHLTRLYLAEMVARRRGDVSDSRFHCIVSSRSLHIDLCRNQGVRSAVCRRAWRKR